MYYFPSIIFKYFLTVGTDNPVRLAISFLATPSPIIRASSSRYPISRVSHNAQTAKLNHSNGYFNTTVPFKGFRPIRVLARKPASSRGGAHKALAQDKDV